MLFHSLYNLYIFETLILYVEYCMVMMEYR